MEMETNDFCSDIFNCFHPHLRVVEDLLHFDGPHAMTVSSAFAFAPPLRHIKFCDLQCENSFVFLSRTQELGQFHLVVERHIDWDIDEIFKSPSIVLHHDVHDFYVFGGTSFVVLIEKKKSDLEEDLDVVDHSVGLLAHVICHMYNIAKREWTQLPPTHLTK